MESKKIQRLSQIINNEEAMKEAMASIERFVEYPAPEVNGNAVNALAAYALDSKYKEKNMETLGVSNLPDEACQILFREYFKVYVAKYGNIVGELTSEMDDALKAFKKRFEALYPTKDANAISAWLYRKLHWKVCLSNADKEEISTRIDYLDPQKAYCHLRTLKLLCFEESEATKLAPLSSEIRSILLELQKLAEAKREAEGNFALKAALLKAGVTPDSFKTHAEEVKMPDDVASTTTKEEVPVTAKEAETEDSATPVMEEKQIPSDLADDINHFISLVRKAYGVELKVDVVKN